MLTYPGFRMESLDGNVLCYAKVTQFFSIIFWINQNKIGESKKLGYGISYFKMLFFKKILKRGIVWQKIT